MATIIAHRGFSGIAPENSISAIKAAIDIGVDFVEIDIHLSKDRVPVVIHDSHVHRTTNALHPHKVHSLSIAELKALDAGAWFHPKYTGEKIPTLLEVLELSWNSVGLMIEIKAEEESPSEVARIVAKTLLDNRHLVDKISMIYLGSFSSEIIQELLPYMGSHLNNVQLMGIIEHPHMIPIFQEIPIHRFAIWEEILTPVLVENLEAKGCTLWSFTVDAPERAQSLIEMAVRGIITNQPLQIQTLRTSLS